MFTFAQDNGGYQVIKINHWCHWGWGELNVFSVEFKNPFRLGKLARQLQFNAIGLGQWNGSLLAGNRRRWSRCFYRHWRRSSLTLTITRFAADWSQLKRSLPLPLLWLWLWLWLWYVWLQIEVLLLLLLRVLFTIWPGSAATNSCIQHPQILNKQRKKCLRVFIWFFLLWLSPLGSI